MEKTELFDVCWLKEHPQPDISVIIPTLPNRELQTIEYLEQQSLEDFEVLAVSDSLKGNHISDARNHGIEAAKAEIVALTDDDCAPPDDWLSEAVRVFRENPDIVLIEGPLDKYDPGPRHYIGANLAFRRDAALAINGFDQRYSGYRDDTEFGWHIETTFGLEACQYVPDWENRHLGPLKQNIIDEKDMLLMREYPKRYFSLIQTPESRLGQLAIKFTVLGYSISARLGDFLYNINPRN